MTLPVPQISRVEAASTVGETFTPQVATGGVAPTDIASAAALLLADARLPAGDHAHSGGIEAAVNDGRVRDLADLTAFLDGRLWTVGLTEAALAAAAAAAGPDWRRLDLECTARIVSPALRMTSRALGRQLLRVAHRIWPERDWEALGSHPDGPHRVVVLGACAAAAGLAPRTVALVAAYGSVAVPATAALRLLGLDPYAVSATLAALSHDIEQVAEQAAATPNDLSQLPAAAAVLVEQTADHHRDAEGRLFAS
ncbi:MAG: urease accessory protein UreF [Actinobacteria bacterium]|nr:urease accessory protein UreF [Actinomycetota bacterium]